MISWLINKDKNNKEKFREIYDNNFNYVYSFVLARMSGDEKATEELVQDTFLAAWRNLEAFLHKSSYRTWLCGIAKNKIFECYRKQYSKGSELLDLDEAGRLPSDFDIENIVINNETKNMVICILKQINPVYSSCLTMKYIDDYSVKEIAKILNRTPKAVDGILQRAKKCFVLEYSKVIKKEKNYE